MERSEKAAELFKQKFNCSQAVFTAFRQKEILGEADALKLSTVFGAGVACTGKGLCGAVTGGLMAISMTEGRGSLDRIDAKTRTYALAVEFMDKFRRWKGSCDCANILGLDLGVPGNMEKAGEMKLFETTCVEAVRTAAGILEKMI